MKRTYIPVYAKHEPDGRIIPKYIVWDDRQYPVDRVVDIRRRAATKAGGMGLRYTCYILGRERFLFYDDSKWFVEENEPSNG